MSDEITLHEAAERLGVHYMTVYRYVRTGRLPGRKVGGGWLVEAADVDGLRDAAPPAAPQRRIGRERWAQRVQDRLVAGDEAGVWQVVQQALTAGATPEELYLDVLTPALAAIGEAWAAGTVTVADEHRASAILLRLLGRLGPLFTRPGRKRGTVVLGGAPGDRHGTGTALLADPIRGRGFHVVDLGADTPAESFAEAAAAAGDLVAVAIGVTNSGNDDAVRRAVAAVHAAVDRPVILGGPAAGGEAAARAAGADHAVATARDALDLLEELARPRRARPVQAG